MPHKSAFSNKFILFNILFNLLCHMRFVFMLVEVFILVWCESNLVWRLFVLHFIVYYFNSNLAPIRLASSLTYHLSYLVYIITHSTCVWSTFKPDFDVAHTLIIFKILTNMPKPCGRFYKRAWQSILHSNTNLHI